MNRISVIQGLTGLAEQQAQRIAKTIDQQFSGFYWKSASKAQIKTVVNKAVSIQEMLDSMP